MRIGWSVSDGDDTTLTLDGGNSPATVVILRIDGRLRTKRAVKIELAGGLTADRVAIYVRRGRCKLGVSNSGSGTLSEVDFSNRRVTATVFIGGTPRGVTAIGAQGSERVLATN